MSEFTVEISRPGEFGALTSATLELPATWAEYTDAMEKARINFRDNYNVEICNIRRSCLKPHILDNVNLLELNLLTQRLANLPEQENGIFSAMVAIEGQQGRIPLPRLINFTHSVNHCRVAYGVHNDAALGKWLFENDMLPKDVRDFAIARIFWGSETGEQRFGMIGARHRQVEGGAYCDAGYVEMETVNEVYTYVPGATIFFDRTDAPVVLEVNKGFFNDLNYDNSLTATLNLPAIGKKIVEAVEAVEAASHEELGWRCTECLIPAARELINGAENVYEVDRFAKALKDMERHTLPRLYKAMFEKLNPPDLSAATDLIAEVDAYTLDA